MRLSSEVDAMLAETVFNDESFLDRIIEDADPAHAKAKRTLLTKIKELVDKLVAAFKGEKVPANIREMRAKLTKAFKSINAPAGSMTLEGAMADLKSSAPVEISDDSELAKLLNNRGDKSVTAVISDFIFNIFSGERISFSDGREVTVDKRDARKLAQYPKNIKTAELSNIKRIIETAAYDHSDTQVVHPKFREFHYYMSVVRYNDRNYVVELNVGVSKNDGASHLYNIKNSTTVPNGKNKSHGMGPAMPGQKTGVTLPSGTANNSISQPSSSVNTNTDNNIGTFDKANNDTMYSLKERAPITEGSSGEAFYGNKKGQSVKYHYALADVSAVVASHDVYGDENAEYPAELQPRTIPLGRQDGRDCAFIQ